ncbi:hypothetical protein TNCV_2330801 [Trichonephila clavipes]|nr:hypothetical protein TNCV_2330801 [Trichonephila clavipes]
MAIVLDEMDLSSPHSRPTTPNSDVMTEETPCQRLVRTNANIKRFTTTREGYKQILTSLESDANHDPTNALYVKIQKEYEEISALLENGVSDFGCLPRCTTIDCPLHTSHANSPSKFSPSSPTHTQKRNNEGFMSPRQTAKRVLLENPSFHTQINLENRFSLPTTINSSEFPALPTSQQTTAQENAQAGGTASSSTAANMNTTQTGVTSSSQKPGLTNTSTQGVQPRVTPSSTQNNTPKVPLPPPVMLFITKHYREQLKTLTMIFPNLRTKTTGEFLKLYTNNHEEYHSLKETIKQLHYQFCVITAKNDRPIKVVIKGLPKSTHVDEIKSNLEEQGFEPERDVQLAEKPNSPSQFT